MKQRIEIEVDMPEGYEFERFGEVKAKEVFLNYDNKPEEAYSDYSGGKIILRKVEPEKPQYKSFLIDWGHMYPTIKEYAIEAGMKIDNYRIFGFGDHEEYGVNVFADMVPCNEEVNYKYAYGKLEV